MLTRLKDGSFAMVPAWLYLNRTLNGTDRDVFGVIALCVKARVGSVQVSQDEIAEFLGLSARQVKRSIAKLVQAGAIKPKRRTGCASIYVIETKPAKRDRAAVETERKPLHVCAECKRICKSVDAGGVCRSCRSKQRIERISRRVAREEIERIA
jgi:predicted transcriptional regulator